jgi:protein-tyrosine phosphatase
MTTSILAVCTGNVCRSPAVERLLLAGVGSPSGDVTVTSAGTHALVGQPIDPPMAELIRQAGAEPAPFAARQLEPAHVREADLVLVMTRRHRSAVVALEPAAIRRTFLLLELAGLASSVAEAGWPSDATDPAARLAMLPRLAAAHRGSAVSGVDLEVPDPYRQSIERYVGSAELIHAAVNRLLAAVDAPGAVVPAPVRRPG